MKRTHCLILALAFSAAVGCAHRAARDIPEGQAIADFDSRVKAYAELRDRMAEGAARLEKTAKAEEIAEAEKALAAKIQAARATAKRGDIFTPSIQRRLRGLLNPELRGVRGQNTRGIIMDENPGEFPFKVNGVYPKEQPLATIPPNILAALPPLPEGLEYRFIEKHLILRDAQANLIIDYIPNAIA